MTDRKSELARNLDWVNTQIAEAANEAGRSADEITLVAVSKTWPASDVRLLHSLGQKDFGENRAQEAIPKAAALFDLDITWHHIGQIQTNKAGQIVRYANVVQSIDRSKAAAAIARAAAVAEKNIEVLVQVSLDSEQAENRAGAEFPEVLRIANEIQQLKNLSLLGLMAVAPLGESAAVAFSRMAPLVNVFQSEYPKSKVVSIGMSGDFKEAIAAGATHVRIGSLLFGNRG